MGVFVLVAVLLVALLLGLVPHLLWFFAWLLGKAFHYSVSYAPFGKSAVALILLAWGLMAYGYYVGRFTFDVQRVTYTHPEMPAAFDGYKVVHISDLHLSTFNDSPKTLQRIVDSINAQQPDLICFTGDLISLGVEEALPYAEVLSKLSAKDGVLSVLGNHDFMIYSRNYKSDEERKAATEQLVAFQREKLGWKVLRNESVVLKRGEDTLSVLGVDNHACKAQGYHTVSLGDLPKAMEGTKGFRVLLSHDPTHWKAEVLPTTDIPLQLSGHTHSAQVRLFGWTPASWTFDETAGMYEEQDASGVRSLYINVGLGCTMPMRIGCNGEITVFTFRM